MLRHIAFSSMVAAALALSMSSSAQDQNPKTNKPYTKPPQTSAPQAPGKQTVIVTGCVSQGSGPGSYVLTASQDPLASQMSQHVSGTVPTPTYQLVGRTSDLQGLVGHRVEVKGTTERQPEKTVDTGKEEKTQPPRAEGTSGKSPTVTTQTKEKVELRRLDVQTLRSVEGACR